MADFTNKNGDIPSGWKQQAEALRKQKKWDDLISRLSAVIPVLEADDDKALAYLLRGYAYEEKGEYDDAIADYNKAIELNPNNAAAYNNRGRVYNEKGEYDRAIADCNKTIELQPDNATAYNNRGRVYSAKGEYDRAIADYNKAIEVMPNYATAYNNRGGAYNEKGEHDRAIADYNKAIELRRDYAAAYNNRGHSYADKGEHDKALADWEKAIKLAPQQNPEMVDNLLAGIKSIAAMRQKLSEKISTELEMAEGFKDREKEHDEAQKRTEKYLEIVLSALFAFYLVAFAFIGLSLYNKAGASAPWDILPWIPVVFLTSSPAIWAARILNRDKTRHFVLRENAYANKLMMLLLPIKPRDKYQEGLFKKFFDHHDLHGSPQLIIDLENKRRKSDDDVARVDDSVIRQLLHHLRQSGGKTDGK